ncbi:DmpA family aminopeptidase [Brucella inopinata]|uniref:P1 family peptidase n=1 Tax=Brucella inopinata TaxID=1218315 RepID=A0AAW7B698_9HYPH|nr:P1 family peptidase [Brucella inopinata]EFM55613.1 peptidase S58 DmpA [Brucella inopinata BO1]KEY04458.1 aminopeptidase [Brucella suis bv. 4 str. 40]MDL2334307.1 P1 family peptidase [Brucella inopinata]
MTGNARDFGIVCGIMPTGERNAITDVPGVQVGHHTLRDGDINTGVTAIIPHGGNLYRRKVLAACDIINGFGKSTGLVQIEELGSLETPILLTNTFGVGTCANVLIRDAIAANPDIGRATATVNPVVLECNDGPLNDIQAMAVTEEHARLALHSAQVNVPQGNVGAGTGMTCFGFKGGIGTSSRRFEFDGKLHHLGILALTNFGRTGDLVLPDGRRPSPKAEAQPEKGSVILVLATDVAMEHRQLKRVTRRCGAGLARLGAFWGHGSGDIAIGFTTGVTFDHDEPNDFIPMMILNENRIDTLFRAAAEATEEAVLNSMCQAQAMRGRAGNRRRSLADWLDH